SSQSRKCGNHHACNDATEHDFHSPWVSFARARRCTTIPHLNPGIVETGIDLLGEILDDLDWSAFRRAHAEPRGRSPCTIGQIDTSFPASSPQRTFQAHCYPDCYRTG